MGERLVIDDAISIERRSPGRLEISIQDGKHSAHVNIPARHVRLIHDWLTEWLSTQEREG